MLFCFSQNVCRSQGDILAKAETPDATEYLIKGDFKIFEMDNLGDLYLLNNRNQLLKFNVEGVLRFEFSLNGLGEISNIDVSNPQKILLYYPQYQNIVIVDNTLSEIKRLNLEELGYWDIQAVAVSKDNNIWIHDPINHHMLKIDPSGGVQLSSNEFYNPINQGMGFQK